MEYEPGTAAVATVRGVPNIRVWRTDFGNWRSAPPVDGWSLHDDSLVTDALPLVVLDFRGVDPEAIVEALRNRHAKAVGGVRCATGWSLVADQIEAQTKPPRIPEPKGVGAVVEVDGGVRYVRDPSGLFWRSEDECQPWSNLNPVRVLSPGIND